MSSGPSGKHRPVTGHELLEQRSRLIVLAAGLPYILHPDEPPPLGSFAALGRKIGVSRVRVADWWNGRRKMQVFPAPENTFANSYRAGLYVPARHVIVDS